MQTRTDPVGAQMDAQPVVDALAHQIGQLHVQLALREAQLAEKDKHIEQLRKIAEERHTSANGHRVTPESGTDRKGDTETVIAGSSGA